MIGGSYFIDTLETGPFGNVPDEERRAAEDNQNRDGEEQVKKRFHGPKTVVKR